MRASLDGYNLELSRVLEIKCPGKEDHKTAMAGAVPEKYLPQVQYQLLVTGAKEAHYFSFDGEAGCIVEVKPDAEYQAMLVEKVKHFWEDHVLKGVPPEPTKADKVFVTDPKGVELFSSYRATKAKIDALSDELTKLKEEIVKRFGAEERPVECAGVQLMFQRRRGTIDLDSIEELKNVNIDKYRKPDTSVAILRVISE
jgi:predicted phage-related endonuclease